MRLTTTPLLIATLTHEVQNRTFAKWLNASARLYVQVGFALPQRKRKMGCSQWKCGLASLRPPFENPEREIKCLRLD